MDHTDKLQIRDGPDGVILPLRVTPRASRTQIDGIVDGQLRVRLAAPPVEGAANDALVKFLSQTLKVPKSTIQIVAGQRGRAKSVLVRGASREEVLRALRAH